MYYVAAVLLVLSGLFYAASHHEVGSLGVEMCRYGSTFCDNPVYVLVGAVLAAVWGAFVSIRYSDRRLQACDEQEHRRGVQTT